jgi:hypothetical protein
MNQKTNEMRRNNETSVIQMSVKKNFEALATSIQPP